MTSRYKITVHIFIGLACVCIFLTSCKKFLDEKPSKGSSVVISTTADLNAMLNNYADFFKEADNVVMYGTDDNGFSANLYDAQPFGFSNTIVQFSLWDIDNLPQTDQSDFTGANFWSGEYTKIFTANLVLANVATVTGSAEDKAMISADAHFVRAYSYWQLANTYCLPYTEANKNEPGVPIKLIPDYSITGRGTLADTYAQIESDLTQALTTTVPLLQNGVARNWRANKAAVNGFAARFYLNKNDYAKALQYANAALGEYSVLVDYNTDMRYGNPSTVNVNGQDETINFPYTHDKYINSDPSYVLGWKEFLYCRILNNNNNWYIPSQDLMNLYDAANDLRYKYHFVQNYSYSKGFLFPPFKNAGYVFFDNNAMPEGPTVAEMLLTKAECQARAGDVAGAITTVNQLYSKRTVTGTPPLTAASQDAAIAVVLKERRRELPFSQRWFDIRRFNSNAYANDDVSLTKQFYPYTANAVTTGQPLKTYTLPKGSRRFASPLPLSDVTNSNGLIKQNTY